MRLLITGGAGFIGSALIRHLIQQTEHMVINVDKLTYAGNLESLASVCGVSRYQFEHNDICHRSEMERIFKQYQPDAVIHLAAESHVDRSIDDPGAFIQTNIVGTYTLLSVARNYWLEISDPARQADFRFHHVSTDEVYGDLGDSAKYFTEESRYDPSSPYSASKASSDHLVRAWHRTYGLPTIISNCSNNYGPYQFPEKLIPLMILNALDGALLPVYGQGLQVRDWLYVEDHARALYTVLSRGTPGETYNIGGRNEMRNIEVVNEICILLDELSQIKPRNVARFGDLIQFVTDRPGHDQRYAIDSGKIRNELGWEPEETIASGLRKTVQWYLSNQDWCHRVQDGSYRRERLGLVGKAAP